MFLNWPENRVDCIVFNQPYRYTEISRFSYKMGIHAKIRFQTQMLMLVMVVYSCNLSTSLAKAGDCCELKGQLRLQGQALSQTKQMKQ